MDYNSLKSNAFNFTLNRLPNTSFHVVQCNIPSIMVPPPEQGHPQAPQYFPGSATEYTSFNMSFIVDENLSNYEEIYNWIMQQRFAEPYTATTTENRFLVSDGILVTLTNSSNKNRTFMFRDMFPISVSEINFDTRDSIIEPVICSVEFRFSEFSLLPKTV